MQHRGEIVKATWLMVAILVAASSTVRAQQAPLPQVTPAMPEAAPAGPPPAAAPDQSAAPAAQASAEALAPRPATPAPPADRRVDIKLLEGVLNAAVKNGADRLALQMRASEPGSLFVIDAGRTRGFDLQGYGVFFDVDVPMMKQSVLWSASALSQQDRRAQLQNYAATLPEGPARDLAINELRRMQQQGTRQALPQQSTATQVSNSDRPIGAASTELSLMAAPAPAPDPRDPNELYTEAVKTSLIDAMLKYSVGLKLGADEWLTVAARDAYGPPTPGLVDDASTIIIRIKGSDLAAFHGNKLTRDEVLKRVEVKEF
jgi:hypothetical protein